MDNPSKYVGLGTIPTSELLDLKEAIEAEIQNRQKQACHEFASDLLAKIKETLSAGFSIIIEDSEDEIEVTPTQAFSLEVTVYPTIPVSDPKVIR